MEGNTKKPCDTFCAAIKRDTNEEKRKKMRFEV